MKKIVAKMNANKRDFDYGEEVRSFRKQEKDKRRSRKERRNSKREWFGE